MSEFENDLQKLTFLKRTIALLSSMVDSGECHTTRSKEMKNNAQQVILEMEANVVRTSDSGLHLQNVSAMFKTEEECIDYFIKIMPFAIAPTRPAKTKLINPFTSYNAFLKVAEVIGKSVFNLH